MKIHKLKTQQFLPLSIEDTWDFFSSPGNLNLITPDDMSFEIISGSEKKTYAGQLIHYKITPILNTPMNWVTEITKCVKHKYFIDEQRFGPYKFWHHQHQFTETEKGVLMEDILHYALPYGVIGELFGLLTIHDKVRNIFKFREDKLNDIFATKVINSVA